MNVVASQDRPFLFEDFEAGAALGSVAVTIDDARLALWRSIYGEDISGDAVPQGLLTAAMMEAYLRVIPSRPPGNVHASQKLAFSGIAAMPGARLDFEFSCLSTEVKRERRWVRLGVRCREAGRMLMEGEIQTIWAR